MPPRHGRSATPHDAALSDQQGPGARGRRASGAGARPRRGGAHEPAVGRGRVRRARRKRRARAYRTHDRTSQPAGHSAAAAQHCTAHARALDLMNSYPTGRPRIGVDFHTFDGIFQGSRSHILGLYQEAIALAPEIDFVFLLGDPDRLRREHPAFDAPNAQLVAVPHASGLARLGWQLAWLQRKHRLDLLHVQYRLPLFTFGPCACTIHDTLFETHPQFFTPSFVRMSRWTSRHAVRRAKLLFTVSAFSQHEIARLYGVDAARIAVTTNGIDRRRFHPGAEGVDQVCAQGLAPGDYICTIGRLEPRKNHLNLLRAYARLPAPRLPLVVIGQRDFHSDGIFAEAQQLGIAQDVRFLEKVPDQSLPALLRHAAVFVYP
ncbi:MAG: glycosyltransferase family 1 protein, partial [Comamonadaceae bacterium]